MRIEPVDAADVRAALEDGIARRGRRRTSDDRSSSKDATAGRASSRAARRPDNAARRTGAPPALQVSTIEPVDEDADAKSGYTFFIVLILYGQLLTYGYWVAAGVVEEKASRVVEVVLSTIRPRTCWPGR